MSINFEQLRILLKSTLYPVYRDKAPKNTKFPYIVYSLISKSKKVASHTVYRHTAKYQVSLFTTGTEKDLEPIEKVLERDYVPYTDFVSIQGDENDDTVTNFFTQVVVIENG